MLRFDCDKLSADQARAKHLCMNTRRRRMSFRLFEVVEKNHTTKAELAKLLGTTESGLKFLTSASERARKTNQRGQTWDEMFGNACSLFAVSPEDLDDPAGLYDRDSNVIYVDFEKKLVIDLLGLRERVGIRPTRQRI